MMRDAAVASSTEPKLSGTWLPQPAEDQQQVVNLFQPAYWQSVYTNLMIDAHNFEQGKSRVVGKKCLSDSGLWET
ncbi:hypothetical protein E2C01_038085 [Portunus trituberculatus]|uniref:Uncharacterized protein n=1 Tax=Portunus trituberculatus TaxID=210409 RepID=A0A5B7FD81_PORTR|nr:hypothetical protein [Portunus trituberculatus]